MSSGSVIAHFQGRPVATQQEVQRLASMLQPAGMVLASVCTSCYVSLSWFCRCALKTTHVLRQQCVHCTPPRSGSRDAAGGEDVGQQGAASSSGSLIGFTRTGAPSHVPAAEAAPCWLTPALCGLHSLRHSRRCTDWEVSLTLRHAIHYLPFLVRQLLLQSLCASGLELSKPPAAFILAPSCCCQAAICRQRAACFVGG